MRSHIGWRGELSQIPHWLERGAKPDLTLVGEGTSIRRSWLERELAFEDPGWRGN